MSGRGNRETVDAVRHALKERVLKLLAAATTDEERADLAKLAEWLAEDGGRPRLSLFEFLQSPPFYFFFGLVLLITAFITTYAQLNSSLTFLVAMLGVAILLYGTGSQAAGTFGWGAGGGANEAKQLLDSYLAKPPADRTEPELEQVQASVERMGSASSTSAIANVAIAGGAAVLAAFFGWGVLERSERIRQVFRDYDQYSLVRLEFCDSRDAQCAGDVVATGPTDRPQPISAFALAELQRGGYLETGLGRRAYGRPESGGLEFVIFDRDLGNLNFVQFVAGFGESSARRYQVGDGYFSIAGDQQCLSGETSSPCGYFREVADVIDVDKVPRHVIRVVVREILAVTRPQLVDSGQIIAAPNQLDPR